MRDIAWIEGGKIHLKKVADKNGIETEMLANLLAGKFFENFHINKRDCLVTYSERELQKTMQMEVKIACNHAPNVMYLRAPLYRFNVKFKAEEGIDFSILKFTHCPCGKKLN